MTMFSRGHSTFGKRYVAMTMDTSFSTSLRVVDTKRSSFEGLNISLLYIG